MASLSGVIPSEPTSSIATIDPRPLTSPITEWEPAKERSWSIITFPMRTERSRSPSDSIVSIAASAAAQESGLPPNVPPRPPG